MRWTGLATRRLNPCPSHSPSPECSFFKSFVRSTISLRPHRCKTTLEQPCCTVTGFKRSPISSLRFKPTGDALNGPWKIAVTVHHQLKHLTPLRSQPCCSSTSRSKHAHDCGANVPMQCVRYASLMRRYHNNKGSAPTQALDRVVASPPASSTRRSLSA